MIKVLLADDKQDNSIMLGNYFRMIIPEENLSLFYASNGDEAFEIAKTEIPNLILMDIKMQNDDDGFIATKKIKNYPSTQHIPVWLVSAYSVFDDDETKSKFELSGCSDYIPKPFEPISLIQKISKTLNVEIPEMILDRMKQ